MNPGKGAFTPMAAGFFRWNAIVVKPGALNVMISAFVPVDEVLKEERNVAQLQIAPQAQLLGDVL